jgi:tetratricopeptide (TPR) repeat protein
VGTRFSSGRQAHELYRALGDRLGEANALTCLGTAQRTTGQQRALELYRTLGAPDGAAEALNGMGELAQASATAADALYWYEQALAVARDVDVPLEAPRALEGIAQCQLQDGRPAQAGPNLREALASTSGSDPPSPSGYRQLSKNISSPKAAAGRLSGRSATTSSARSAASPAVAQPAGRLFRRSPGSPIESLTGCKRPHLPSHTQPH